MNYIPSITDETNSGPPAVISPSSATTTMGTEEHGARTNSSVWQPTRTAPQPANLEVKMEEPPEGPPLGSPVCHSTPNKNDMPHLPNMMSQELFHTQRTDGFEEEELELEENGGDDSNDSFNYESDNLLEDLDHLDETSNTPQDEVPLSPSSQANLDVLAKKGREELSSAATDVLRSQNSQILSTRNSFNCAEIAGTRISQETRHRMQEEQKTFVNNVVEIMRKLRGTQRVKIAIRECHPAPFTVSTFGEQCVKTWKDALKSGQVMLSDFFLEGYESGLPSYQHPRYYITRNVHWLVALKALSKEYRKRAAKQAAAATRIDELAELEGDVDEDNDEEEEEDEAEEGEEEEVSGESGENFEARRKRRNKSKKLLPEQDPYATVDALIVFDDRQPKLYAPKVVAWFMSLTDNNFDPQSTIIDKAYNCYFAIKLFHLEHEKPTPVRMLLAQHKLNFKQYAVAVALLPKAQLSMLYATRATREINCEKFLSSYLKARAVCRQTADDLLKDVCGGQETTRAAIEIFQQHLKQVKYFLLGHEVIPNSAALIQSRVSSQHALPHLKNKMRKQQSLEHSRDVKSILRELASAMNPIVPFKNVEITQSNSSITQSRLSLVLVSYEDFKDNPGLFEELLQRDDSTWKVFVITKAKLEDVYNLVKKRKKCPGLEPYEVVVVGCVPFVAGEQAARKNCVQCVLVSSVNGQCLSAHDLEARLTRIGVTTFVQIQHLRMITYNCESESGTVNPTKKSLLPFLCSTAIECLAIVAAMCCHTIYVSKAFTQKADEASSAYAQLRSFQAEAYETFPSPSQLTCLSAKTLAMRERKAAKKRRRGSNDEDVDVEEEEEDEEFAEEPGLEDTSATSDSSVGDTSILKTKGSLSVSRLVSMAPPFQSGHGQSPADKRRRSQSLASSVPERGARGVSSASVRTATSTADGITPVTTDTTRTTAIRKRNQRKLLRPSN